MHQPETHVLSHLLGHSVGEQWAKMTFKFTPSIKKHEKPSNCSNIQFHIEFKDSNVQFFMLYVVFQGNTVSCSNLSEAFWI